MNTEFDIEELRAQVDKIDKATKAISESGITWEALLMLVQNSAGTVRGKKIPIKVIRAVFHGFDNLKAYVFEDDEE